MPWPVTITGRADESGCVSIAGEDGPMELPPGSRSEVKITVGGVELGMEDDTWSYLRDAIGSDIIKVKPGGTEEVLVIEAVHGDVGRLSLSIFLKVEAHADCDCEYLLLPIDLTTSPGGVVSMADEIDFGTLTSARDTVIRHVELGNVGSSMAAVDDVRLAVKDEYLQAARFRKGQQLPPGKVVQVAELKYAGYGWSPPGGLSGKSGG
ncbi:hypothetical protein CLOM_g23308, partial [Closterium sp. NIES-68]